MKKDITELFCFIDDFCKDLEQEAKKYSLEHNYKIKKPTRTPILSESEIITIMLIYHCSEVKNFKAFYTKYIQYYRNEFPNLPSYERFVILQQRVLPIICILFLCIRQNNSDINYIDSTPIKVCHNKRIFNHKVFKGIAERGKSSMGWFYGFKLHLIIDEKCNIGNAILTKGNCDDRIPVEKLILQLQGILLGDKGYISKELFLKLYKRGIKLVTGIRKDMKNILMDMKEKVLLRKRSIIETVFGYLKRTKEIEHTRHRSVTNMLIHVISTLVSYQLMTRKPCISPAYKALS
jgi:hypothetical protein